MRWLSRGEEDVDCKERRSDLFCRDTVGSCIDIRSFVPRVLSAKILSRNRGVGGTFSLFPYMV